MKHLIQLIATITLCLLTCYTHAQWTSPGTVTSQTSPNDDVLIGGSSMSGAGVKMFWDRGLAAFRGGSLSSSYSTNWDNGSLGTYSFSYGLNTKATGRSSFSFGELTTASGTHSTAFGKSSTASGFLSTAFGNITTASGFGSTAFGYNTTASGVYSTAFGSETIANNDYSTAFGSNTSASGTNSIAFGKETFASGTNSIAFGELAGASGTTSTAFGFYTDASGTNSTAFGEGTSASGTNSTAFGSFTSASGTYSIAFGQNSTASGEQSISIGGSESALVHLDNNIDNSIMMGWGSTVPTFFIGESPSTSGTGNVSIGGNTSPQQKLVVSGAIEIGTTTTATDGAIRYDGTNFQGHTSGNWINLSGAGGSGGSVWSQSGSNAVYTTGNAGIGTSSPTHLLHVAGDLAVAGSIVAPSDRRLKQDITDINDALDIVDQLQPKSYNYKPALAQEHGLSDALQYGLIAQELELILPTLVTDKALIGGGGITYKGVEYTQLIPILTQAIKELSAENDKLRIEQKKNNSITASILSRLAKLEGKSNQTKVEAYLSISSNSKISMVQ